MTDIDTIALYGPGTLKPDDLVAGFVAREQTLAYFLSELRHQSSPGASPRHHLIIGQRGMGKTTLLLRIAVAVGADPTLAEHLVPLTFREEQYNVINLHVFWRNAGESLLDWLEQAGCTDEARTLEQGLDAAENAYARDRKAQSGGDAAWQAFRRACARLGRRPVLFLDNLNLILEALKKHDWGLRDLLQEPEGPLVIGAAPAYPKGLSDRQGAFFDFFRITTLERLETAEVRTCLHRLAGKRGAAGAQVATLLARDPGRIDALTEMTGGNPRTLALLYLLLESQAGEDAFADLERLLDRMTPLYKARAEEAAPQARAVLDAVALAWDPITANAVARESGLEVTAVNAQLSRLENERYVEKVEVSGGGRSGYQVIERFFNIWYLMRHGSRRLKQRVRWLTGFLRGFYSPGDREGLARDLLRGGNCHGRADWMAALSETMDDPVLRKALNHRAGRDLVEQSEVRRQIEHLVDLRDIDPAQAVMVDLERQVLGLRREWPEGLDAKRFWGLLGGSVAISGPEKRSIVEQLPGMETARLVELTATLRKEIADLCARLSVNEDAVEPYRAAVRDGSIRHRYDLEGASAAALHANDCDVAALGCLVALTDLACDPDQVRATRQRFAAEGGPLWARVDRHPWLDAQDQSWHGISRGRTLEEQGCREDAEAALRKACAIASGDKGRARASYALGYYLAVRWARYEEAESALRQAIALDPKFAQPWCGLGVVLRDRLDRDQEAEAAFRQAITLDPQYAPSWYGLGVLLRDRRDCYEEAEAAYRQAIALDPEYAHAWIGLGVLLQGRLGREVEAEQTYRHALELGDAKTRDYTHGILAQLYWIDLNRPADASLHAVLGRQVQERYIGYLLDATGHLAEDAPKAAFDALDAALSDAAGEASARLWGVHLHRIQRTLRFAHTKGYAPQFRAWMESADYDYPARYAPLYWAFLALLEGEAVLRNVSPEVRRTAERIYKGLVAGAVSPTPVRKAGRRRQPR